MLPSDHDQTAQPDHGSALVARANTFATSRLKVINPQQYFYVLDN